MTRLQPMALVLWGPYFDEAVAVPLACGLRRAGVWVKLVGVQARPMAGQHGVILQPDLALGQVARLIAPVACLAIPCAATYLPGCLRDPRLGELWQRALADDACFVIAEDWPAAALPQVDPQRLLLYPQNTTCAPVIERVLTIVGGRTLRPQRARFQPEPAEQK